MEVEACLVISQNLPIYCKTEWRFHGAVKELLTKVGEGLGAETAEVKMISKAIYTYDWNGNCHFIVQWRYFKCKIRACRKTELFIISDTMLRSALRSIVICSFDHHDFFTRNLLSIPEENLEVFLNTQFFTYPFHFPSILLVPSSMSCYTCTVTVRADMKAIHNCHYFHRMLVLPASTSMDVEIGPKSNLFHLGRVKVKRQT